MKYRKEFEKELCEFNKFKATNPYARYTDEELIKEIDYMHEVQIVRNAEGTLLFADDDDCRTCDDIFGFGISECAPSILKIY